MAPPRGRRSRGPERRRPRWRLLRFSLLTRPYPAVIVLVSHYLSGVLAAGEVKVEFIGAFESIYMPAHDLDVLETSGHCGRWKEDLALLRASGITTVRYPIRWHRIERRQGLYDWQETDEVL